MASTSRRRDIDLMKLVMSDYEVEMLGDGKYEFEVQFAGPDDSGVWKVHVQLPPQYPFKSPSIGFRNRMFHPNVDERSGSVCLDVINQTWSPMFDLINVFDMFLPQLLRYPNPEDPLNGEAASLLLRAPAKYHARVKEHVRMHATPKKSVASAPKGVAASNRNSATASGVPLDSAPQRKESDASHGSGVSAHSAGTAPAEEEDDGAFDSDLDIDDDDDDDDCSVISGMSELSDD